MKFSYGEWILPLEIRPEPSEHFDNVWRGITQVLDVGTGFPETDDVRNGVEPYKHSIPRFRSSVVGTKTMVSVASDR